MKRIRQITIYILSYSLTLYLMHDIWQMDGIRIASEVFNSWVVYIGLGCIYAVGFGIMRSIIQTITTPLAWMTFGLSHWVISIVSLYLIAGAVTIYIPSIIITLGGLSAVAHASFVLSIIPGGIYWIGKKMF